MPTQHKGKTDRIAFEEIITILKDLVYLMEDIKQLLREIEKNKEGNKKHQRTP